MKSIVSVVLVMMIAGCTTTTSISGWKVRQMYEFCADRVGMAIVYIPFEVSTECKNREMYAPTHYINK